MGEIYLAHDLKLGRKVALKLLPEKYTQDQDRLRRFKQEAYAASALNHPNIITIFEIGEAGDRHFISAEFIEGATLRERLAGTRLAIGEVLEIATQVLSALASAHAAGIIHRDIKPENIMIRPDGYVKILDFGLAKLTEKAMVTGAVFTPYDSVQTEAHEIAEEAFTETDANQTSAPADDIYELLSAPTIKETTPGVVMGTAQYMSPEQARGLKVDLRTDIFSFGIVLFEMVAGRLPFAGQGGRGMISSILHSDPLPLSHIQPKVPEVLEWITAKALVKEREERYQTAKEMLHDIKRLQTRLGAEQELSRSRGATPDGRPDFATQDGYTGSNGLFDSRETISGRGERQTGAFERRIGFLTKGRFNSSLLLIAVAVFVLGGGLGISLFIRHRRRTPDSFQNIQISRFTSSGKATRAAISPDGRHLVYSQREAGKESLLVSQVSRSNNVVIVPPADVVYRGMTYSSDGNFIYYVVQEQNNPIQKVYQVPGLGGVPRRILVDCDSPITLSPDGTRFAFVRRSRGKSEDSLITADIDGNNERTLAVRKGADFFWASGPAWSPDGKVIACPAGTHSGSRQLFVAEVRVEDGRLRPISTQKWTNLGRVAWTKDGCGLLATATEQGSALTQIWYFPYPDGAARRITNDLNDYRDMSLALEADSLVTVRYDARVNVWLLPSSDLGRSQKITDGIGQYNGVRGLTWTPDDRIVYVSRASGSHDIWLMNSDGKNNTQLTTVETSAEIYPSVSPDGRYLVFVSTRTGNSNIYRLDMLTGDQVQLTKGASEEFPTVSVDGKWVIYTDTSNTNFTLWKVSIDGGEPIRLTNKLSQWPAVSPDGKQFACWYRAQAMARWQIAIIPISGGEPEKVIDVPNTAETSIPFRWMPDGTGISFADTRNGATNIWRQPLSGGPPRQLTRFTSDQIYWFDWSRDGKYLACSRGAGTNDVVLIDESK